MEKKDPSKQEVKPVSTEHRKVIVKGEDGESTDREHHEENLKKAQKLVDWYENEKKKKEKE